MHYKYVRNVNRHALEYGVYLYHKEQERNQK